MLLVVSIITDLSIDCNGVPMFLCPTYIFPKLLPAQRSEGTLLSYTINLGRLFGIIVAAIIHSTIFSTTTTTTTTTTNIKY